MREPMIYSPRCSRRSPARSRRPSARRRGWGVRKGKVICRALGRWLGRWSELAAPLPATKQQWFDRAITEFGAGLTRNLFEAVWAKADLPAELRRPGRR